MTHNHCLNPVDTVDHDKAPHVLIELQFEGGNKIQLSVPRFNGAILQVDVNSDADEEKSVLMAWGELAKLRPYLSARDCAFFAAYFSREVELWDKELGGNAGKAMINEMKAMAS